MSMHLLETVLDFQKAAKNNYPDLCKLLLSQPDIDVNKRVGYSFPTAFHTAVMLGHRKIVKLLAKAPGINFNLHPNAVEPAAIMAMSTYGIVEILTQTDIDWNYQDG